MSKHLPLVFLTGLFAGFVACAGQPATSPAWDQTDFALRIFRQAAGTNGENFILSPYSASSALGLVASGASGETAAEMRKMLCMSETASNSVLDVLASTRKELLASTNETAILETTDSLWPALSFPIERTFMDDASDSMGAFVRPIPMDANGQKQINDFVCEATHGRIPVTFAQPPDGATRLIVLNTVYFNGKWTKTFKKTDTSDEIFHSPEGDKKTPFLRQTEDFPYFKGEDFAILRLPYSDGAFEMAVLLPDEGTSLGAFEASLSAEKLREALASANESEYVNVELPKFEFASTIPLNAPLQAMGMKKAFSGAAEFPGISREKGLLVSDVFQKANVTVDEEGTIAAAVTAIAMCKAMPMPREPLLFHADRPFLFLIRHGETGQILFIGRVTSPVPPADKKK